MGSLICFEGLDGAGKSAVLEPFQEYLKNIGLTCGYMHFPNKEKHYGKIIYEKLNGEREIADDIFQGLYVLDFYSCQAELAQMLKEKDVVILDRYFFSTLAYSNFYGYKEIISSVISKLIMPVVTFYLRVPIEVAIARLKAAGRNDAHESNITLLEKTSAGYDLISDDYGFITLDADAPALSVLTKVIANFNKLVLGKQQGDTVVINGDCHPSDAKYFVRAYEEDDGTYDVDVFDGDDRDDELERRFIKTKEEAVAYAVEVIDLLKPKGTVAVNLPD